MLRDQALAKPGTTPAERAAILARRALQSHYEERCLLAERRLARSRELAARQEAGHVGESAKLGKLQELQAHPCIRALRVHYNLPEPR